VYATGTTVDYDGDGTSDNGVYNQTTGKWNVNSSDGSRPLNNVQWGWGDVRLKSVSGDFDGDGKDDLALYNQSNGKWYVHSSEGTRPLNGAQWGWASSDQSPVLPVPADFDGDGECDMGIYAKGSGKWYVHSSDGSRPINGAQWGWAGSRVFPVPADYDGDGKADMAIFDGSTGKWYVHSSDGSRPINGGTWGWSADTLVPVPADFDSDGKADLALYDASNGQWYIHSSAGKGNIVGAQWGWGNWFDLVPVPANYDGDGEVDLTVYDKSTGKWYIHGSAAMTKGGAAGDLPPNRPVDVLKPTITRLGTSPVVVQVHGVYNDAGATAVDNYDGNITSFIKKTGTVDTSTVGNYMLYYNVSDTGGNAAAKKSRQVKIVDTTPPVITLNPPDLHTWTNGMSPYVDPQGVITDNYDTGISWGSVSVTGSVNVYSNGMYVLSYDFTDSNGNPAATVNRAVNVVFAP